MELLRSRLGLRLGGGFALVLLLLLSGQAWWLAGRGATVPWWLLALTIALAGGALLWLLERQVVLPLVRLRDVARLIGRGELRHVELPPRGDELGELAGSIEQMVRSLLRQGERHRLLAEAVIGLAREPAGEGVLRRVGELAREITGARYAMLAWVEQGEKRFLPLGMGEEDVARLRGRPPQGLGLLGLIWNERRVVRIDDIAGHPQAIGFPPGHPPMRHFLGAPIEFSGEMFGALYLTDREDGRPFDQEDEQAVRLLAAACATALANARRLEELERARETLERRVTERTAELEETNRRLRNREIELELLNEELRQASESKSQFLANTSHELRTPLNAIIGFSDLLLTRAGAQLGGREREYVQHINTSGRQLLQLINSLLDLSKIEAGMMEIDEEATTAGRILEQVLEQLRPLADSKGLELVVRRPPRERAVFVDAGKLQQVWTNLLGNAIKFVPEGGRIEVGFTLREKGGEEGVIEGYVLDNGPGIEAAAIEHIFEPFVQAEGGLTREHGGTGLGLALVRRLLEIQGGSIGVESVPGERTRFHFRLPARLVASGGAQTAPEPAGRVGEPGGGGRLEIVEEEPAERSGRPLVLIVDDDGRRAAAVSLMLEEEGYEARICGMEEVEREAEEQLPFIIMVGLPRDPVEIYPRLHRLRSRKATRSIPLVLLAGDAEAPHFSLGTVDAVDKGLTRNDLLDIISRYGHQIPRLEVMTVLVVDDDPAVRDYIREALHGQGYRILLAADGREGLKAAIEHEPDLIILDLMMPGMSGFEVVEALKRHPTACDIPVVIFTAKDLTREEVMRLGQEVEKVLAKGSTGRTELLRELRSLELLYPLRARLMDSVLRCFNPRYLQLRLPQECSRGRRYGQRFSLVGWELDGYEDYVARHGQRWGLAALRETVELVQSVIRKGDVLVRSGEAAFILLLPGITPAAAERVAEKIRLRIRMCRYPLPGEERGRFTASFGCAHFAADGEEPEPLQRRLQARLERARAAGGDRCICCGGEEEQ